MALKWMPKQKRARGRPTKNWMEGIRKAMYERNLNEGQWEDRKQWSLGVGQRRKTFWNIYIHTHTRQLSQFCENLPVSGIQLSRILLEFRYIGLHKMRFSSKIWVDRTRAENVLPWKVWQVVGRQKQPFACCCFNVTCTRCGGGSSFWIRHWKCFFPSNAVFTLSFYLELLLNTYHCLSSYLLWHFNFHLEFVVGKVAIGPV